MKKNYDYKNLTKNWYHDWIQKNIFDPKYEKKNTFCIVIPPPNITGRLHMGHAFQCTIMDLLVRYYRMNDYSVLWKVGTDHAGIATQLLIEQKIKNNENKNIQLYTEKWKKKSIKNINLQIKELGCSVNWKTQRFTLDKHFSYAVKTAFIKLYNENLIYKSESLVNWDFKLQSAISDLEIYYKDQNSKLYYIKYFIENSNNYIIISTTRPETIFADVAIAVNPNDNRYKNLINKNVYIPIIDKKIPIITDNIVDINFGTGCLKITPGHDFTDYNLSKKYNLPIINILNKDGTFNFNVPTKYQKLKINEARSLIYEELKNINKIEKTENYINKLPFGDRSDNIIEPLITEQWFVKTKPLIHNIENLIKKKKIKIIPQKWDKIFFNWINEIKDWCISRQIWWGHRIPVWYDDDKNIYVAQNEKEIKKIYKLPNNKILYQEKDVLDTWFSSALWPFASLGWPNKTKEFNKFFPTNILVTGFDIIFFWVIRMIMFSIKFTNEIPFEEIYIHGLIKDDKGQKMSKTKGNVIDPLDIIYGIDNESLIKKYVSEIFNKNLKENIVKNIKSKFPNGIEAFGLDSLRMAFISMSTEKTSMNFDFGKIKKYKNFCNKIWNIAIFFKIKINLFNNSKKKYVFFNEWILSLWQKTKKIIKIGIEKRNFAKIIDIIYKFIWNEFCDWYIEIVKNLIENIKYNLTSVNIFNKIFDEILKIMNPIAPYLTEEIFFIINDNKKVLSEEKYPIIQNQFIKKKSEQKALIFKLICNKIRNIINKNENKLNINISIILNNFSNLYLFEKFKNMLIKLTKIKNIYLEIHKKDDYENLFIKDFDLKIKKNLQINI